MSHVTSAPMSGDYNKLTRKILGKMRQMISAECEWSVISGPGPGCRSPRTARLTPTLTRLSLLSEIRVGPSSGGLAPDVNVNTSH